MKCFPDGGGIYTLNMNYKLEKFWNLYFYHYQKLLIYKWTINLKSFEIRENREGIYLPISWTINLKSFEIESLLGALMVSAQHEL